MFDVRIENFEDLTEDEAKDVSNNGCGKEYATYLRVLFNGKTILLKNDAMEGEDASFYRDLHWIKDALLTAYKCGIEEEM